MAGPVAQPKGDDLQSRAEKLYEADSRSDIALTKLLREVEAYNKAMPDHSGYTALMILAVIKRDLELMKSAYRNGRRLAGTSCGFLMNAARAFQGFGAYEDHWVVVKDALARYPDDSDLVAFVAENAGRSARGRLALSLAEKYQTVTGKEHPSFDKIQIVAQFLERVNLSDEQAAIPAEAMLAAIANYTHRSADTEWGMQHWKVSPYGGEKIALRLIGALPPERVVDCLETYCDSIGVLQPDPRITDLVTVDVGAFEKHADLAA